MLEAFFVAAEIALVSVRRSRIDQLVSRAIPPRAASEAAGRSRPVPRRRPDRPHVHRLLRLGFAAVSLVDGLQGLFTGFGVKPGTAGGAALGHRDDPPRLFTIIFAELIPSRSRWPRRSGSRSSCRGRSTSSPACSGPIVTS
jgi:hypothetical protein